MRIVSLVCFLSGLSVRDVTSNPVNCADHGQWLGTSINCLQIGPQPKREKPELPEKPERPERPERPEFPESELYEPEEPDIEEPEYRGLGWGTPRPCPPGNKNCNRGGNGGSHGVMGVYKAAAFIGVAILIAILVTILSLVIYCVWKRRRDIRPTHINNGIKISNASNGYATPGGKCSLGVGGSGAICTCTNTGHQCCEQIKVSRPNQHDNAHHYAGPSHNTTQPSTPVSRKPQVIPYAQSEAYPSRSDKTADNDDNLRGYMGLIKSRPEGDPKHPTPPNHPRTGGITQAVNHEYHLPHHGSAIVGTPRINHPREPQQTHALSGGRDRQSPDADPYYFKLDDSPNTVQPRSMMPDGNVPDLIANRPLPSKELIQERSAPAVDERMVQKGLSTQRGGYDAIFVHDGLGSEVSPHNIHAAEESYDKLDRSRKSFRPRDNNGDYNTISLDVLKM
nr:uncharacterized protein LOC129257097 [Lytechinus pictus]